MSNKQVVATEYPHQRYLLPDRGHVLLCLRYTQNSCFLIIPMTQDYISVPKESFLMLEDLFF